MYLAMYHAKVCDWNKENSKKQTLAKDQLLRAIQTR